MVSFRTKKRCAFTVIRVCNRPIAYCKRLSVIKSGLRRTEDKQPSAKQLRDYLDFSTVNSEICTRVGYESEDPVVVHIDISDFMVNATGPSLHLRASLVIVVCSFVAGRRTSLFTMF